ncbi:MAG: 6-phospho-3-hexuloisomerase [Pirellulaceae bacterium]|nr:6-phospho-3-hexuloisomerase [Pirellulaceae bacterium]
MFQRQNQQLVLDKISEVLDATDESYADHLTDLMDNANRVFIAGAGRSKLVGNFLAMRLMHGGYNVSVVGEITTPAIKQGDLLITISGSGETEQLIAFTRRARAINASIVLITAKVGSSIGELADQVFQIGVPDVYAKVKGMPMGTVFELSTLCFLEALISHIIWEKGVPEEEMKTRHANLE